MKQSFMMRLTSRRFFSKYNVEEISFVCVGGWDEVRASLVKRGFQEKDGQLLVRKNATLARILSCDWVLQAQAEDTAAEILRQRERCRALAERRLDAGGKACYIVLLYKDRVAEEDVRALKRGQADALAFEKTLGPQKIGGTILLVLVDKSAETGFYCRAAGPAHPVYDRGCRALEELFGEIC